MLCSACSTHIHKIKTGTIPTNHIWAHLHHFSVYKDALVKERRGVKASLLRSCNPFDFMSQQESALALVGHGYICFDASQDLNWEPYFKCVCVHLFFLKSPQFDLFEPNVSGASRLSGSWTLWLERRKHPQSISPTPPQDVYQTAARSKYNWRSSAEWITSSLMHQQRCWFYVFWSCVLMFRVVWIQLSTSFCQCIEQRKCKQNHTHHINYKNVNIVIVITWQSWSWS